MNSRDWIRVTPETMPKPSTAIDTHWVWGWFKHQWPNDSPWEGGRVRWIALADAWKSEGSPSDVIVSHYQELPDDPEAMVEKVERESVK